MDHQGETRDINAIRGIFDQAADLSPEQRPAFLDATCGGDAPLRSQVESLLQALDGADDLLVNPTSAEPHAAAGDGTRERPGSHIGRYKLLQQIGEGGMGVVFMAEQEHPVRRTVALKVLKVGMRSGQVIARFEAERQALALMDHPGIAKVFDAGETDAGQSYFVMELVRGIPITEYCDKEQLAPRQRLELFVHVCQAVQHAHTKGIIHRDLKPTNILVTLSDGKPTPKVIDFGIAKATAGGGQRLTDRTLFTEFRQLIGTPLYMSPEQAEMSEVIDVDTRSDVYSLGVLLYEMLTGSTPFDKNRMATAAYDEVRRIIREEDPPTPSTRLSGLGEALTTVSAQRHTEPKRLAQLVRGELDWIVMRALEKDRTRRYETAGGFARDVERYLADAPVEACPPSKTYRFRKFARRNKTALATGTLLALVLIAATAVSTWQAVRATRAEREVKRERDVATLERSRADEQASVAKAVNEFLNHDLLAQASPIAQARSGAEADAGMTVRQALDRASANIAGRFTDQPLVEAGIRHTIGTAYYSGLRDRPAAQPHFESALELRRKLLGEDHPDTIATTEALARVLTLREHKRAEAMLRRVLEVRRRTLGVHAPRTLDTMYFLASLNISHGDVKGGEAMLAEATAAARATLGDKDRRTLVMRGTQAFRMRAAGDVAGAAELYVEILARRHEALGDLHPDTIAARDMLAGCYISLGRVAEGEALLLQVLEQRRKAVGEQHEGTRGTLGQLTNLYQKAGRTADQKRLHDETLEYRRKVLGPTHRLTLEMLPAAERLPLERMALGERHSNVSGTLSALAEQALEQGRLDEAEKYYREALAIRRNPQDKPPDRQSISISIMRLVKVLLRDLAKQAEAEELARENLQIRKDYMLDDTPGIAIAQKRLGEILLLRGKLAEAEPLLLTAYVRLEKEQPSSEATSTAGQLVQLYRKWGKSAETVAWESTLTKRKSTTTTAATTQPRPAGTMPAAGPGGHPTTGNAIRG